MKDRISASSSHLKKFVQLVSFGGLFLSLSSTLFVWAGTDSFKCSDIAWKSTLIFSITLFFFSWLAYIPFRNSNRLIGHGILSLLLLINLFMMFGFSMFYFYFIFAPINIRLRLTSISTLTAALFYRAFQIKSDIVIAFQVRKKLFHKIYLNSDESFSYERGAFGLLQNARTNRNPFKSFHGYAAILIAPLVLSLNKILTPYFGDGNGVFLILAFFAVPILLWGTDIFVQTAMMTVYYPIKLERQTGKLVLLKDW